MSQENVISFNTIRPGSHFISHMMHGHFLVHLGSVFGIVVNI